MLTQLGRHLSNWQHTHTHTHTHTLHTNPHSPRNQWTDRQSVSLTTKLRIPAKIRYIQDLQHFSTFRHKSCRPNEDASYAAARKFPVSPKVNPLHLFYTFYSGLRCSYHFLFITRRSLRSDATQPRVWVNADLVLWRQATYTRLKGRPFWGLWWVWRQLSLSPPPRLSLSLSHTHTLYPPSPIKCVTDCRT